MKTLTFLFLLLTGFLLNINAQSDELVVVDSSFGDMAILKSKLPEGVTILDVSGSDNPWGMLFETLTKNVGVNTIHMFCGVHNEMLTIGNKELSSENINAEENLGFLEGMNEGSPIFLMVYTPRMVSSNQGYQMLQALREKTFFNINTYSLISAYKDMEFDYDFIMGEKNSKGSIL